MSLSLNLNWVDKKLISSGAIAPLAGPTSPFAFRQRLAQAKKDGCLLRRADSRLGKTKKKS